MTLDAKIKKLCSLNAASGLARHEYHYGAQRRLFQLSHAVLRRRSPSNSIDCKEAAARTQVETRLETYNHDRRTIIQMGSAISAHFQGVRGPRVPVGSRDVTCVAGWPQSTTCGEPAYERFSLKKLHSTPQAATNRRHLRVPAISQQLFAVWERKLPAPQDSRTGEKFRRLVSRRKRHERSERDGPRDDSHSGARPLTLESSRFSIHRYPIYCSVEDDVSALTRTLR